MVQQAAALAANLAAQVHRWPEFRSTLRPHADGDVKALVLQGAGARLVGEVAHELIDARSPRSRPTPRLLAVAVVVDLALGRSRLSRGIRCG